MLAFVSHAFNIDTTKNVRPESSYKQLWSYYSTTKAVISTTALDLSTTMANTAYCSAILLLDSILYLTSVFTYLYPV